MMQNPENWNQFKCQHVTQNIKKIVAPPQNKNLGTPLLYVRGLETRYFVCTF